MHPIRKSYLILTGFFVCAALLSPLASAQEKTDAHDRIETFPVGTNPSALAFDGANIWVADSTASTISELRASDGVLLGTFPDGGPAVGAVFDGENIWVTNLFAFTVTKLRASDGALLATYPAFDNPYDVLFDGTNIWVASAGSDDTLGLGNVPPEGNCQLPAYSTPRLSFRMAKR